MSQTIVDHARGRVEQIHLIVVMTNVPARDLHRSLGFVTHGAVPRALRHAGRDDDEAPMVRQRDRAG